MARKVIVTAVKNEGPFMLEWIAYHKAIGFDRVVVVSNDSDDGTTELLRSLHNEGHIIHHDHPVLPTEHPQAKAAKIFNRIDIVESGDWCIWLDADEFLNIHTGDGSVDALIHLIGKKKGMLINWRIFGDSNNEQFNGRFISERFINADELNYGRNNRVKTFFQYQRNSTLFAELVHRPYLQPHARFNLSDFLNGRGRPIDSTFPVHQNWVGMHGRASLTGQHISSPDDYGYEVAQINHYSVRTYPYFLLKRLRGRGSPEIRADGKPGRERHTQDFFQRFNRNEAVDRSILRHESATTRMLDHLQSSPRVADTQAAIMRLTSSRLAEINSNQEMRSIDKKPKKFLVSAVKNEGPFLIEWIAYHRSIGFDRIFIVSNDSDDGTTELLNALHDSGIITHVYHTVKATERPQGQAAILLNRHVPIETGDWGIWLDADEFLNIHAGSGLVDDLIAAIEPCQGMLINWHVFGDSFNASFDGRFISDSFTRCDDRNYDRNNRVKTFFRYKRRATTFNGMVHRPFLNPAAEYKASEFLTAAGQAISAEDEVNRNWLGQNGRVPLGAVNIVPPQDYGWSIAQINHYTVRTRELFDLKRHRGRGSPEIGSNGEKGRERHTDAFFKTLNRNEHVDESILRHAEATTREIESLMSLPGVAAACEETWRRTQARISEMRSEASQPRQRTPAEHPVEPRSPSGATSSVKPLKSIDTNAKPLRTAARSGSMSETKPAAAARGPAEFKDIQSRIPDWKPDVIFDVGANVGQSSVKFLAAFPAAVIHAFEPVPDAFVQLSAAVEAHSNVHAYNIALGRTAGTVPMRARGTATGNRVVAAGAPLAATEELISVPMETGDAFAARLGLGRISYLKIDTEGHDYDVLLGFTSMLERTDFVQVEAAMNPYNKTHVPFRLMEDLLRHHGFLLFRFYDQALEFGRGGRPVLRRTNPLFINSALVDLKGLR